MGILNKLKNATGIGLSARERYVRAFEKAVLLGPENYASASELFEEARAKAEEEGDASLADRARANSRLYGFISSGDNSRLGPLLEALRALNEIEQIGLQTETMEARLLVLEVEARIAEATADAIPEAHYEARAVAYSKASDCFKTFFASSLLTYRYQARDRFTETAQQRFFLHQGLAAWNLSLASFESDPEKAAEHMTRALGAFRQCGDDERSKLAEVSLGKLRQRRSCWLCHREFQGADLHFKSYDAAVAPYATEVVKQLGQDTSSLDAAKGSIVLCKPCGSMVERQADLFARRRTEALERDVAIHITSLKNSITSLEARVAMLALTRR